MNDLEDEIWKDLIEWEQFYQISNLGRLKSKHKNKILNPNATLGGFYTQLCGRNDGKRYRYYVHYLVWWTFITKKINENTRLHHRDGNNLNNNIENLLDITDCNGYRSCKKCHISKEISEFPIRKDNGLHNRKCDNCLKQEKDNYYIKNKETIIPKVKTYYKKNKSKIRTRHKQYYQQNKGWINKKDQEQKKRREKTDISYRLRRQYKHLLYCGFKRQGLLKNGRSCKDFIGCSFEEFKKHIESQFEPWMNWENYGKYGWHFGHIHPCELFDLTNENHVKICFHYSNIKPQKGIENTTNQDFLPDGRRARDLTNQEKIDYLNSIRVKI